MSDVIYRRECTKRTLKGVMSVYYMVYTVCVCVCVNLGAVDAALFGPWLRAAVVGKSSALLLP